MQRSPNTGLMPFIKLNEYFVDDSQKCIEYLSKVMEVDLNSDLTEEQKAISRAVRKMCENSLFWYFLKFFYNISKALIINLNNKTYTTYTIKL